MGESSAVPVGSVDDVKRVNGSGVDAYNTALGNAMGGFSSNLGSAGSNAMSQYGRVADTASNYDNYLRQLMGAGGNFEMLRNATSGFDPQASVNQLLSLQPQLAAAAQSGANAGMDQMYTSGRSQAAAAGDAARRQAANDLAAAGLLSSGGAVGAMTEATANPMLQMETALAGQRSQLYGNLLGGMQQGAMSNLGAGYGANLGLAGQLGSLGLGAMQGQTGALQAGAQGTGSMAGLYGGLYGQGLGLGAQMNAPEYWQPQYTTQGGWQGALSGGLGGALQGGALGASIPGGGFWTGLGGALIGGLGGAFAGL